MAALSPCSPSFASATASSSLPTRYSEATGPKVSSYRTRMEGVTASNTVGAKKNGPCSGSASPPTTT